MGDNSAIAVIDGVVFDVGAVSYLNEVLNIFMDDSILIVVVVDVVVVIVVIVLSWLDRHCRRCRR